MSIHTLEENRFIEKLAGSTEVFNFQSYSCILSTFLFQRSGLEAETLSLKVPTCIFGFTWGEAQSLFTYLCFTKCIAL